MTKKNRVATAVRYDSDRMFRQLQEARAERDRASTVSGSWPVLARIATSLGHLDDAAHPLTAPSETSGNGGRAASTLTPGAATRSYRRARERIRRRLNDLARDIDRVLDDPSPPRQPRKRCPKCGRGGRPGAEICDRAVCEAAVLE